MPRWMNNSYIDDDFDDEDFNVDDSYTNFEKIKHKKKSEEERKAPKKKNSVKHQKREDKL